MKIKAIALSVLLAASMACAVNNATAAGDIGSTFPADINVVELFDTDVTDAIDSVGVDSFVVLGPYKLCAADGQPMYAAFKAFYAPDFMATGDSAVLEYAFTTGASLADTTPTFTAVDTATDAGEAGAYTAFTSQAARGIVFKIKAIGDTQLVIKKAIKILFKKSGTFYKQLQ